MYNMRTDLKQNIEKCWQDNFNKKIHLTYYFNISHGLHQQMELAQL